MIGGENESNRASYLARLALSSIDQFHDSFAGLEKLVHDLKWIFQSLRPLLPADLAQSLHSGWGALEIVYALMLDERRTSLDEGEWNEVREDVAKLRAALASVQ